MVTFIQFAKSRIMHVVLTYIVLHPCNEYINFLLLLQAPHTNPSGTSPIRPTR
jgi:hypothetical protein